MRSGQTQVKPKLMEHGGGGGRCGGGEAPGERKDEKVQTEDKDNDCRVPRYADPSVGGRIRA